MALAAPLWSWRRLSAEGSPLRSNTIVGDYGHSYRAALVIRSNLRMPHGLCLCHWQQSIHFPSSWPPEYFPSLPTLVWHSPITTSFTSFRFRHWLCLEFHGTGSNSNFGFGLDRTDRLSTP